MNADPHATSTSTDSPATLQSRVDHLEAEIDRIERERREHTRKRRRQLLGVGLGLSLLVHIGLMFYLNAVHRSAPGRGASDSTSVEFAMLTEEELTELESVEFEDLLSEEISQFEDLPAEDPGALLTPEVAAAELEVSRSGAAPALGGSGDGAGGATGLSGGGAGTSFFGVSSRGNRFAYVVDISGSMAQNQKFQTAMAELARSISDLPDYGQFYITLFSSDFIEPPMQRGWLRARPSAVRSIVRWLETVDPKGGTNPRGAFHQLFSLEVRPDVIFFLTDGQINNFSAEEIADLNRTGKPAVINTIAFGDDTSQLLLKQIAADSGGVYRFVPTGGLPR